jgi:RND superfamily putative drug exporter
MFARLGRLVAHRPWWVIGVWLIAIIAVGATAPKLTATTDESSFLPKHYESVQAIDLQQKAFPNVQTPAAIIVFERADGKPLSDADTAKVDQIAATLSADKIKDVTGVAPGQVSPNRLVQLVALQMTKVTNPNDKTQTNAVKAVRSELGPLVKGTDLQAGVTGQAAQTLDQQSSSENGIKIIGIATIVLILVLLLIIFRSPILALLPVILLGLIDFMVNGLVAWVSKAFDLKIDSTVNAILLVVLFGVGTDYILFLMFRYRERLRAGEDPQTAIVSSVTRVGEAITSAAGAVIIAFLALLLSTLGMFRSLGPALAITVAVTVVAGLTLVPAVVSLLGTKVFWPSQAWRAEPKGARFAAIGTAMGRRPAIFAVVSAAVLIVLAIGSLSFHPTFDMTSGSTSNSMESAVYSKELLKGMPAGVTEPTDVLLRSTDGAPLSKGQLAEYQAALTKVPGVGQVNPPIPSADGTVADFRVTLNAVPESNTAMNTVKGPLRSTAHAAAPPGTTALVGGITSVYVDIQAATNHDYAVVFPVAAVLIMVVLGLLLRSVVAPWYLMASVGLGFAATLGATVLVFQHAKGDAGLIFMMPIIMYLFVVALGTDYNILMVARLREEAREGLSPREAASMAVRHAGPTIAAAGLILAGTFASMTLAGNSMMQQIGFAVACGIALVAFVMAMFLTPALTALIGHIAWWPGHGDEKPAQHGGSAADAELAAQSR